MGNQNVTVRETAKPPSLEGPLASLTDDYHSSPTVGFIATGWTPPPEVSGAVAEMLPGAIADHRGALHPAAPEEVVTLLSRMSMSLRLEDMPEQAWKYHLEDYADDLSEYPADIIQAGCKEWRRYEKFWPTIADFLKIVRPLLRERKNALQRLEVLQRVAESPAPDGIVSKDWHDDIVKESTMRESKGPERLGSLTGGIVEHLRKEIGQ